MLWLIAAGALTTSLIADRGKTGTAVLRALRLLWSIVPSLVGVLAIVSLVLAAVTPAMLHRFLASAGIVPFLAALGIGSLALMPGFIAFPLAAALRQSGASNAVLAAFITSLMMVGVLTLPLEARFFGWRLALIRNALALGAAVVVAIGMTWVLA